MVNRPIYDRLPPEMTANMKAPGKPLEEPLWPVPPTDDDAHILIDMLKHYSWFCRQQEQQALRTNNQGMALLYSLYQKQAKRLLVKFYNHTAGEETK